MKYVLKYKLKSRYFGFVREYLKEFNSKYDVFFFIVNNNLGEWNLYKQVEEPINDLFKGEEDE